MIKTDYLRAWVLTNGGYAPLPIIDFEPLTFNWEQIDYPPTRLAIQSAWNDFVVVESPDLNYESESYIFLPCLTAPIEPEPPAVIPTADWDSFNATMLADVPYNQAVGTVLQLAPAVATGLPTTLAQVATNGVSSFSILYNAFCQIGQVSVEQKGLWADLAESFNLPADFVGVLRGN